MIYQGNLHSGKAVFEMFEKAVVCPRNSCIKRYMLDGPRGMEGV